MATRSERLNLLTIGSSCSATWEDMAGDDRRRFCMACSREVLDFARMTEREIAARIEVSRGRLCARLTRIDGSLVTLPPSGREPCGPPSERRTPSVTAALVTAFLGVSGGAAQASSTSSGSEVAVTAPVENPTADESEQPVASFSDEIQVVGEAPVIEESVTLGVVVSSEPLRLVFERSALTILATVGEPRWIERDDDGYGTVATELRIQEVLRGSVRRRFRPPFRSVFYLHSESIPEGAEVSSSAGPAIPGPTPGSTVLAILEPSTERRRLSGLPVYELGGWGNSVKEVTAPEAAAYGERLAALAAILGPEVIPPLDLAEWLVSTAEEPLTRAEVMSELADDRIALTETQRQRLLLSLLVTEGLTPADLELYDFVSGKVLKETDLEMAAAIRSWLRRQLARDVDETTDGLLYRFSHWSAAAERLGESRLEELADEAEAEIFGMYEELESDELIEAHELLEEQLRPIAEEHRRRFAEALAEIEPPD